MSTSTIEKKPPLRIAFVEGSNAATVTFPIEEVIGVARFRAVVRLRNRRQDAGGPAGWTPALHRAQLPDNASGHGGAAMACMRHCAALVLAILLSGSAAHAAASSSACESDPAWHRLDFWVGHWTVVDRTDGSIAGTSVIEKTLRGCAISVDWHDAGAGGEVREIFYYQKATRRWRQIWISDAGPAKERESVEGPAGSVQFLGEVRELSGGSHLDRSTVTPQPDGRVHQLIEISRDGGATWKTTFDAEYGSGR